MWSTMFMLTGAALVPNAAAEEAAIRKTFEQYVQGFREGSLASFERAFIPGGQFVSMTGPNPTASDVKSTPFVETSVRWSQMADPSARGEVLRVDILNPSMASMTARLDLSSGSFDDQFLLYKINGHWLIAAKTSSRRSEQNP